jgi:hypothetical protein
VAIRLAVRDDDAGIRAVLRRNAMPGAMALAFAHEPSFFDAVEVEGDDPRVMVADAGGAVVGMGVFATRRVYVDGAPARVGYLSSLRLDPAVRGATLLARGYRMLRDLARGVPYSLSTIMEDNAAARALLTAGRAGLPAYREAVCYVTLALPLARRRAPRLPAGLRLVDGDTVGADALAAYFAKIGPRRQWFPAYTADDLRAPTGLLRGLALRDIAVALAGDRIAGTLGGWCQLPFRQHVVTAYAGALRGLRPLVNLLAGCRLLPPPGEPVRGVLAACPAVRDDDPAVFRALLAHRLAAGGGDVCFLGLATGDPLLPVAREPWHIALHSRLYTVSWGAPPAVDARVPYLELGSL